MDTENNSDSSEMAAGAQAAPVHLNSGKAQDASRQLQASVLQFMRQNQGFHESLSRLMDLPSNELSNFEKKIGDLRSATERNLELIRNYRH